MSVAEDRLERRLSISEELPNRCCDIKNRLMHFADTNVMGPDKEMELTELGDLLEDFNKSYKKRRGRKKRTDRLQDSASEESNIESFSCRLWKDERIIK